MQHTLQSSQLSSSLSMVSAGGGFALVPKSMAAISPPNVTYHALSSPELYTDIALCWRRFERSRTVKRFLAMMSEGNGSRDEPFQKLRTVLMLNLLRSSF